MELKGLRHAYAKTRNPAPPLTETCLSGYLIDMFLSYLLFQLSMWAKDSFVSSTFSHFLGWFAAHRQFTMLPPILYGSYKRYKPDTDSSIQWLVEIAEQNAVTIPRRPNFCSRKPFLRRVTSPQLGHCGWHSSSATGSPQRDYQKFNILRYAMYNEHLTDESPLLKSKLVLGGLPIFQINLRFQERGIFFINTWVVANQRAYLYSPVQ